MQAQSQIRRVVDPGAARGGTSATLPACMAARWWQPDSNARQAGRARAAMGIAMGGSGTDVALEAADLSTLLFVIAVSRAAHTIVQQNMWAAFGMITLWIRATLFGLARMGLAMPVHEGATVLVAFNALRLLRCVDTAAPPMTQRKKGALTHGPQKAQRVC